MNLNNPNLAVNGGKPLRNKPWLDNFTTGKEEKEFVIKVMNSGYMSLFEGSHTPDDPFSFWGGPVVQQFEKEWANWYGASYAVSMNSATSCLYAAIGALGIGFGDEIIVSPYTMTACAAGALIYGAIPVFADVDPGTGCLDPDSIAERITQRTKAILLVHQFGIPADMDRIMPLARKHGIKVIEDCAQAHGAKYKGQFVGTFGDIGVFSLNVNKTIQTGEGGVCITADEDLRYRLALIRNHGEAVVGPGQVEDITNMIGFNYRFTELQAAIGIQQLKKLDMLNRVRIDYVNYLTRELEKIAFLKPLKNPESCHSTFYVFPARFCAKEAGIKREEFVETINAEGLMYYQGYTRPLYLQPVYQRKTAFKHGYPFTAPENKECLQEYQEGLCPNAEKLHFEEMLINEHVRLPNELADIKDIIRIFEKVINS